MSLELNKILGAVFGTVTFTLGVSFLTELIFERDAPEKPGFEVAAAAEAASPAAEAAAPAAAAPIGERLASADAAAGEKTVKACAACHVLDKSGANKVGPGLWNVVGRKPGSHEAFAYSGSMTDFGNAHAAWDYALLDAFLTNPKAEVPGTKMAFAGLKKPEDRANVIAYLRSLSDNPAPLP